MKTNLQRSARPQPRRTQRERRELSHHRMLDAALTLIARQGSSRTTLSQIGEASGYTHGLVSHRFGCKSELVRTLIQKL
ncbi:MAG TPA: helix-turn-helix domain-containing protein, partial [Candidatus Dormibacteraeota bacterium]|nr:helix-turn-helix domain-containing protein [Candidatus Dormibacteraeota bacterium]